MNSNLKYDPSRYIINDNYKDVLNQNRMDSNRNAKELYLNKENEKNYKSFIIKRRKRFRSLL